MATKPYATPTELREHTNKTLQNKDNVLSDVLLAVSECIDNYCNRIDGFLADTTASTRVYSGSGTTYQLVDDFIEITAVGVKESVTDTVYTAWATTEYIAFGGDPEFPNFNRLPYNGIMIAPSGSRSHFLGGRYTALRGFRPEESSGRGAPTVQVTAKWGYALYTPPAIKQAALIQASRVFKRGESAYADVLGSQEFGQVMYRKKLDSDVELLLTGYCRPAIGARR